MFLVADPALLEESPAWSADFDELVDLEDDGSWRGRARGVLHVIASPDRLLVDGRLTGTVPRECHLCLAHYLERVSVRVVEVCEVAAGGPPEAVFDDEAEAWRVGHGGRVNVTEMVRQAVVLGLPTRAACGACPERSEARAGRAGERPVDPRLAVLRKLLATEVDDGGPEASDQ
ncbi:MAG: DUF177 domain-containing protein [Armatimonadetes bacterium]|nr:DUF177 domain-containing protein [Armatimonadota bacterium]